MTTFRLGGRTFTTPLTLARALRDENLARLRRSLAGDDPASQRRFDQALTRALERAVGDLSGRYARELEAALDRIATRRAEISGAVDRAIAGQTVDVGAVRRAMDDLAEALRELHSPLDFLQRERAADPAAAAGTDAVRRFLAGAGDDVDEALRRFDAAPMGGHPGPAPSTALPAGLDPQHARRINASIGRSRMLQRLRDTSPSQFAEYLAAYVAKGADYAQRTTFATYAWFRMRSAVRGALGEFDAAHQLPGNIAVLKGPDHDVTVRGTDLVGVDVDTGRLLVVDNKALAAETVSDVSALTRNLATNLAADAASFALLLADPDVPQTVKAAIRRLQRAATALQAIERGLPEGERLTARWDLVRAVLVDNDIDLRITGAFGQSTDVSPRLREMGIRFLPEPAPAASAASGVGSSATGGTTPNHGGQP